jgi:hypothetical protein
MIMPSIETKILFVGLLVGLAHILSGISVMVTPQALGVTPLAGLDHFADYMGYTKGGFVAATLIGAGLMAVIAANLKAIPRIWHAFAFFPQQMLLLLQIYTITVALIEGKFPDGYIPQGGAFFIMADQIWAFLLAASHSIWLAAFLYGGRSRSGSSGGT